jgi:hypothetical protein
VFKNKAKNLKIIPLCSSFVINIKDNFFKFKFNSFVSKTTLNISLLIGMVFCLLAPTVIFSITGLNLYDTYSFQDSFLNSYRECSGADVIEAPGTHLYQIRTCLATIFFNLIVFVVLINCNKHSGSLANKIVKGASCVRVQGGFEGLGDPDLDAPHETQKTTRKLNSSHSATALEVEKNSLSLSATQMDYHR